MTDWGIFVFRLTFFPTQPAGELPSTHDLYKQVWRADPDNYHRSQNALSPSIATGKRGSSLLAQCSIQSTRIDFNITRAPENRHTGGQFPPMELPLIDDASDLRSEITRMLVQIEQGAVRIPVLRVAYFTQFLNLKSNFAEANKVVGDTIPSEFGVKISNEEDFVFQINRPFTSKLFGGSLKINAVVKWSVERIQMMAVAVPSPTSVAASIPLPQSQTAGFIAGSVAIDINNNPTTVPLSAPQQASILREAIDAAFQIRVQNRIRMKGLSEPEERMFSEHVKPN